MPVLTYKIRKNYHLLAITCFAFLTVLICRNIIFEPGVMVFEDYTPFFTLQQLSVYYTDAWNMYMQVPQLRNYDLFFMWARFFLTSEFAFVLLTFLSGVLLYLSCIEMSKIVFNKKIVTANLFLASTLASMFALMILLYTKLSHFYTLIIGMSMMAFLISIFARTLHGLSSKQHTSKIVMPLFLVAILLWILPAPHFIVLFYIASVSLVLIYAVRDKSAKMLLPLALLAVTHLIPYAVITAVSSAPDVAEMAPVTYNSMVDNSVDPVVFLSSMQASVMDRFLFGSYGPYVHTGFLAFSITLAFFGLGSVIYLRGNRIMMSLLFLYLISIFFSIGVKYPFGGYNLLIALLNYPILGGVAETVLQVLRHPHRWQFLELYVKMILVSASAFVVLEKSNKRSESSDKISLKRDVSKISARLLIVLFLVVLFLGSFLTNPYNLLFSGDFGGALRPVEIPNGISAAKEKISNVDESTIIFLPHGREHEWNNRFVLNQEAFYMFYFDASSMKWIDGGTLENMLYNSLGYYLLLANRSNIDRYYALQNVEWIFFSNDTLTESYVNENDRILSALLSQEGFVQELSEGDYYLFRNEQYSNRSVVKSKSLTLALSPFYAPWVLLSDHGIFPEETIFVDNLDGKIGFGTFENLSDKLKENLVIRFPYKAPNDFYTKEDVVLSLLLKEKGVYVTPNMLLAEKQGWGTATVTWKSYIDRMAYGILGYYGATERKLILSNQKLSYSFDLEIPQAAYYSVYLKVAAPKGADIAYKLGDQWEDTVSVQETVGNYRFVKLYEGNLTEGRHVVEIEKLDNKPVAINLVYAIQEDVLEHHLSEFERLTQENHNEIVDGYDELADILSQLDYPKNMTLLHSYDTVYSDLLTFQVNGNYYKPVESWYSGASLIIDGVVNEHETTHQYSGGGSIYYTITMPVLLSITAVFYWLKCVRKKNDKVDDK
jgi:hypothetical protein